MISSVVQTQEGPPMKRTQTDTVTVYCTFAEPESQVADVDRNGQETSMYHHSRFNSHSEKVLI